MGLPSEKGHDAAADTVNRIMLDYLNGRAERPCWECLLLNSSMRIALECRVTMFPAKLRGFY